jgi:hypothetical protein
MMTKVTWSIGANLSPLYAAARLATRRTLADARLAQAIADPVCRVCERLEMAEIDAAIFWDQLLKAGPDNPPDQVRAMSAFLTAGGAELTADTAVAAITRALADTRLATGELYPRLEDQLPLRGRPLREQWETYGPGLLNRIAKRSHADLIPKTANLWLVHPASGGSAGVVPDERWGWIEAVLTNNVPEIPEFLRVGWMLATIGLGHSKANRLVASERLPRLAAVASVPIVLHAAADLDLVSEPAKLIDLAMRVWEVEGGNSVALRWWEQQSDASMPFAIGIKALDRMLDSA